MNNNNDDNNINNDLLNVEIGSDAFQVDTDDENFVPLSAKKTKDNSDTADPNEDEGDDKNKAKGGTTNTASGKTDTDTDNDSKKSVITEEVRKKYITQIDALSDDDFQKKVDSILDKSSDDLTEEDLVYLEEAGYDIGQSGGVGGQDSESFFLEAAGELGLEVEDDEFIKNLKPNDKQSIVEFTNKVAEHLVQESLEKIFSSNPTLNKFYNYISNGGDESKFSEILASSDVDKKFETGTPDSELMSYMRNTLKKRGLKDNYINSIIKEAESNESLLEEANSLVDEELTAKQSQLEQLEQQQQQEAVRRQQEVQQYWSNVRQTVDKGKLNNFTVPDSEKNAFFEWMARPINRSNQSQSAIELSQLSIEDQLALEYLRYKKFDLSALVANAAKSTKAREAFKKIKEENTKSNKTTRASKVNKGVKLLSELDEPIL